jgi:hypothetical protein
MKKVPYTSNRNYRDFGWEDTSETLESNSTNVNNLIELKKSRLKSFKDTLKNIFKK